MRHFLFFLLILGFSSCDYLNIKKTSSKALLEEELETFNWDEVDEYPSFSKCDSFLTNAYREICFRKTIRESFIHFLQKDTILVNQDINDTIMLDLQVSNSGKIILKEFKIDSLIAQEIPNIKRLINESLKELPEAFPAIKRGQQVTTEFNLPIVIRNK